MKHTLRLSALLTALLVSLPTFAAETDEAHGEHAHVEGDPMGLFGLEMIWATVLFLLFAGILGFFVWPKILKALQDREQKLEGDLVGAEQARKDADAALAEYKLKIAEAQKEAGQVVAEARAAATQSAAKIIADAEAQATQRNERNLAEIAAAKEQAISDIHSQTAELATLVASKILKREINAQDQQQLVDDSLAELTAANN
ncbi:F0F1 ATP synthase subunit B [Phycisphaeraceae bacterium D3-23]